MFNNTDFLLRTACQTMARHGDDAVRYAKSRAEALKDDPRSSSDWEHVSHVIGAIYDEGFQPAD